MKSVAPTPVVLSQSERAEMQAKWALIACAYCHAAHQGLCPRVKRIRRTRLPNGTYNEDVAFWPDTKWRLPPDARTVLDVFGPGGAPPPRADPPQIGPPPKAKKKRPGSGGKPQP